LSGERPGWRHANREQVELPKFENLHQHLSSPEAQLPKSHVERKTPPPPFKGRPANPATGTLVANSSDGARPAAEAEAQSPQGQKAATIVFASVQKRWIELGITTGGVIQSSAHRPGAKKPTIGSWLSSQGSGAKITSQTFNDTIAACA
jgi:hypothetical protein